MDDLLFSLGSHFLDLFQSGTHHSAEGGRRGRPEPAERAGRHHVHPGGRRGRRVLVRGGRRGGRGAVVERGDAGGADRPGGVGHAVVGGHGRAGHAGHAVAVHLLERLEHVGGGGEGGVLLARLGRQLPVPRLDALLLH